MTLMTRTQFDRKPGHLFRPIEANLPGGQLFGYLRCFVDPYP